MGRGVVKIALPQLDFSNRKKRIRDSDCFGAVFLPLYQGILAVSLGVRQILTRGKLVCPLAEDLRPDPGCELARFLDRLSISLVNLRPRLCPSQSLPGVREKPGGQPGVVAALVGPGCCAKQIDRFAQLAGRS